MFDRIMALRKIVTRVDRLLRICDIGSWGFVTKEERSMLEELPNGEFRDSQEESANGELLKEE